MLHAARERDAAQGTPRPQKVPIFGRAAERFEPLVAGVAGVARAARAARALVSAKVSALAVRSAGIRLDVAGTEPVGVDVLGVVASAAAAFLRLSFPALVGATRTASVQVTRSTVGRVIFGGRDGGARVGRGRERRARGGESEFASSSAPGRATARR